MMPNWCENKLIVRGDTKRLKAFKQAVAGKGTDLSLSKLCPIPKELAGTRSKLDYPNRRAWSLENWGTRSDVEATLTYETTEELEYAFLSAWSAPVAWLEKVAKAYPDLDFRLRYAEEMNGFIGIAKGRNGKVIDSSLDTT